MKNILQALSLLLLIALPAAAAPSGYADRLVWIFGWNLNRETDLAQISELLDTAAKHGINGAVGSFGYEPLGKKPPEYFRRLEQVRQACERNHIELIPALFSVGYGGGILSHDRYLAEGLPVRDALLAVKDAEARIVPDKTAGLVNGDFETHQNGRLGGWKFHDQPGEISFVDAVEKHGGQAALRLENFTANQHGHGRVMQEVKVRPFTCYRIGLWVKTDNLQPAGGFRVQVLVGSRPLAPKEFKIPPTTGSWRKLTMLFNSQENPMVRLYAGLWGGKGGKVWLDDFTLEEMGPLNVLRRPGTPVAIKSEDGAIAYAEGQDYLLLADPNYSPNNVDRPAPPLKIPAGSRIKEGQRLRASWYHSMAINDSQITVCMGEPALYEIFEHESKLLAEKLRPKRVFLNMDEVRMGGTCKACEGRDMGQLLGECVTRQAQSLRRYLPGAQVYVWSDMLDPHHNAHGDYYLVKGDFTGSWRHIPKDLTIAVWGGKPRENSLKFFADEKFNVLAACYYDADTLTEVKNWLTLTRQMPNVTGYMYTPWQRKYGLLGEFGDLLKRRN